ncbi:hypothetical protein [Streptomyces silvisoli]|uniref:Uncharacterized protein n=1 Tax=Streptomyces silvisoli TaxID=3034235 RepID=A0ABT5ZP00_9ACTN|nr:hypothetical protein [Streptomyces silvisoli]MDF3291554.1 hypothetical protein [Streptomyces silvisoli]
MSDVAPEGGANGASAELSENEQPAAERGPEINELLQKSVQLDQGPVTRGGQPAVRSTEFVEDVAPAPAGTGTDDFLKIRTQEHMNETRRALAKGMLWMVGILAVFPMVALVFGHWTHFTVDSFRELSLVFTPVVALASAAFGFFFASDDRNRDK